jgi:hypothetical protein
LEQELEQVRVLLMEKSLAHGFDRLGMSLAHRFEWLEKGLEKGI